MGRDFPQQVEASENTRGLIKQKEKKVELDIHTIRQEFPLVNEVVYLNTGTVGISPKPVAEQMLQTIERFEVGGQTAWAESEAGMNESRKCFAALLGVSPLEIAFTRNATDGVNLVTNGIAWHQGDEVLLSDQEHPAMLFPWTHIQQRGYITLKRFEIDMNPDKTLANIREALTPQTRLLATSHVTSQAGLRVPGKEICALCKEQGVLVMLDGAQAVGQFPIDLKAIGCDFYTGNIHKWLLGPKGTGFFYVTQQFLNENSSLISQVPSTCADRENSLQPTWVGAGSGSFDDQKGLSPSPSAHRFEYGTRDFGKYASISTLLDWFEALGWQSVEEHMRELSSFLKRELKKIPKVCLFTPDQWEVSSAMTTFALAGISCNEMSKQLWESHRVLVRTVGEFDAVRISTALFNTREEIELLLRLIQNL